MLAQLPHNTQKTEEVFQAYTQDDVVIVLLSAVWQGQGLLGGFPDHCKSGHCLLGSNVISGKPRTLEYEKNMYEYMAFIHTFRSLEHGLGVPCAD